MLNESERRDLLDLARRAVTARVRRTPPPSLPSDPRLQALAGAFVTLTERTELRGCIGYPEADQPLASVVARCAAAAASEDPRFPPVTSEELAHLFLEISVLGPLEAVHDPSSIIVGRHGLIVDQGFHRGLLLPQVAVDWQWDRDTFLAHTCLKAGLSSDAWRTGARLFRFEAEVFAEEKPTGA